MMPMFNGGLLDSTVVNTLLTQMFTLIGCCGERLVALVIELWLSALNVHISAQEVVSYRFERHLSH